MTDQIELNARKFKLDLARHESELRHKWEQQNHWSAQRLFWVVAGTAAFTTALITAAASILRMFL